MLDHFSWRCTATMARIIPAAWCSTLPRHPWFQTSFHPLSVVRRQQHTHSHPLVHSHCKRARRIGSTLSPGAPDEQSVPVRTMGPNRDEYPIGERRTDGPCATFFASERSISGNPPSNPGFDANNINGGPSYLGYQVDGSVVSASPVPEPSSFALLGLGAVGFGDWWVSTSRCRCLKNRFDNEGSRSSLGGYFHLIEGRNDNRRPVDTSLCVSASHQAPQIDSKENSLNPSLKRWRESWASSSKDGDEKSAL